MGDILSQQEVDSLLSGLSEGKVETETDVALDELPDDHLLALQESRPAS